MIRHLLTTAVLAGGVALPAQSQEPKPIADVGPSELVVCAPGYPGTPKQAQAIMDELVRQLTRRAGWMPGVLTARYIADETEGLKAIKTRPAWLLTTTEFYCKHVKAIDGTVIAATQLEEGASERFTLWTPAGSDANDPAAALRGRTVHGSRLLDPVFAARVALRDRVPLIKLCSISRQKRTLRAVKKATAAPDVSALWLSSAERALLQQPAMKPKLQGWSILMESEPVPSAPILELHNRKASGRAAGRVAQFTKALFALNSTDEGKALCTQMRMLGFARPDTAKYDAAVKRYHPTPAAGKDKRDGGGDGKDD